MPTLISPACPAALGTAPPFIGPARAEGMFKIGLILRMTGGQAWTGKQ